MLTRSEPSIFEVAWRSSASAKSSPAMPMPSSATRIRVLPPSETAISIRAAPASIAFSTSSFTAEAGRSTTSPAAIRLAAASERRRIRAGSPIMLRWWLFIPLGIAWTRAILEGGNQTSVHRCALSRRRAHRHCRCLPPIPPPKGSGEALPPPISPPTPFREGGRGGGARRQPRVPAGPESGRPRHNPSGSPTTTIDRLSGCNSRAATRFTSASVTASIRPLRRSR